ncbi:MAG: flippase [Oscillospiraceae bacterium]|nr:flippase [Oscillospiraceae bacterium]
MNLKGLIGNRIVKNASWLMLGKIIHMVLSFIIGLITARYLGPSNYGLINYAAAYTTFFSSICTLGINSIIVKQFVDEPENEGVNLGSAFVLRFISTFLSIGVIVFIVKVVDKGETVTLTVVTLYSLSLLFQVFDTFRQWFQAKLLSKYYAIATLVSYSLASAYKVLLLVTGKSVEWFAISNSIDFLIVAILLFFFYKKCGGPSLSFSWGKAKDLLSLSYSYILSGMMTAIYSSTDKFMLKQFMDESVVGYYALAVTISNMWVFVLSAVIESVFPSIMENHNKNKSKYIHANKCLYAAVFYMSVVASVVIFLIAPYFIKIVYGEQYLPAVAPLRIVVWFVAFSYLGVARDAWIVCERKQKYLKYLYLGSAVLNIILNFLLIPVIGACGAAVASLITQISTIFIFPAMIKDLRPNVKIMLDAIKLKGVFKTGEREE